MEDMNSTILYENYEEKSLENPPMLTTIDNPYNPFTQFDEWYAFDEQKGYHTCEYLARIARTSYDLTDSENDIAITRAIDEICRLNVLGIYRKAYPS